MAAWDLITTRTITTDETHIIEGSYSYGQTITIDGTSGNVKVRIDGGSGHMVLILNSGSSGIVMVYITGFKGIIEVTSNNGTSWRSIVLYGCDAHVINNTPSYALRLTAYASRLNIEGGMLAGITTYIYGCSGNIDVGSGDKALAGSFDFNNSIGTVPNDGTGVLVLKKMSATANGDDNALTLTGSGAGSGLKLVAGASGKGLSTDEISSPLLSLVQLQVINPDGVAFNVQSQDAEPIVLQKNITAGSPVVTNLAESLETLKPNIADILNLDKYALAYNFADFINATILYYSTNRSGGVFTGDPIYWAYVYTKDLARPTKPSEIAQRDKVTTWATSEPTPL
jgi:hypothetical protein